MACEGGSGTVAVVVDGDGDGDGDNDGEVVLCHRMEGSRREASRLHSMVVEC